ncbi:MAG: methylmalonyl Co-A mutase-associated GTPase MeaB [Rubrivivax sp.]
MPTPPLTADGLLQGLRGETGPPQRRALAKAITLLESTRPDHRAIADGLLALLPPADERSFRLGISGVPGVGKSTFIEMLGLQRVAAGERVAVLAVDPSSSINGGSILGDKTRMEQLSVHERAFIRPSPTRGTLGGVAAQTREAVRLCEAAGYTLVIVETVGVGQSEIAVAGMSDFYVLMQLPNAGDDLQAIKKGVMEIADLVLINKADLDPVAATRARAQISGAMHDASPRGRGRDRDGAQASAQVLEMSALRGSGIAEFWQVVSQFRDQQLASGALRQRRRSQDRSWMWERIEAGLRDRFAADPAVRDALPGITGEVLNGHLAASVAARRLLDLMR